MISPRSVAHTLLASAAGGGALLYRFSPQEYSFYPRCPFFALTHHYCPGCGATRALAELLHGHFTAALQWNAAFTLLLPALLWYFGKMYVAAIGEDRVVWPDLPSWSWQVALAGVALFGIARNLTPATF